jgi:hypothetical protein
LTNHSAGLWSRDLCQPITRLDQSRTLASEIVSWMQKFIDHLLLAVVEREGGGGAFEETNDDETEIVVEYDFLYKSIFFFPVQISVLVFTSNAVALQLSDVSRL